MLTSTIFVSCRLFLSHAVTLLEKQFTDDEDKAMNALDYFSNVWGHYESPVHFAQQFQIEEFISHSFNQKYASRKLFSLNGASSRKQKDTQNKKEPEIKILPYPINITGLSSFIKVYKLANCNTEDSFIFSGTNFRGLGKTCLLVDI